MNNVKLSECRMFLDIDNKSFMASDSVVHGANGACSDCYFFNTDQFDSLCPRDEDDRLACIDNPHITDGMIIWIRTI